MGTSGSGREQGLEASFLALSPPKIDDPVYNGGFLRADAALPEDYLVLVRLRSAADDVITTAETAPWAWYMRRMS